MRKFEFKNDSKYIFRPNVYRLYCNDEPIINDDALFNFSVSYGLNIEFENIANLFKTVPNITREEKEYIFKIYNKLRNTIKVDLYVD